MPSPRDSTPFSGADRSSGVDSTNLGGAPNSFGSGTSLGVPSSSFLFAADAGVSGESSSFFDSRHRNQLPVQGSSDSGNFFRASQPTSSVLGIPERDRQLIKSRYAPKPASSAVQRAALTSRDERRLKSETQQSRRVMARLNQTGSKVEETRLASFLIVNTPYRKGRRIKSHDESHAAAGHASRRQPDTRNQNNASAENGRLYYSELDGSDQGGPMDMDQSYSKQIAASTRKQIPSTGMISSAREPPSMSTALGSRSGTENWRHSANCQINQSVNAGDDEAVCNCNGGQQGKLTADITTDIVPPRRPRFYGNEAGNFDDECGESKFNWHVDATWGCQKYPDVYYCDEDCPSLLEYLLCPEEETCYEDDPAIEWTRNAEPDPDLEAVITFRQGETEKHEVRSMNIVKKSGDDFTVSWKHPPGEHPVYVVVVYPPVDSSTAKNRGPDCGPCVDEEDCICGVQPVFRMHVDGQSNQCDFPVECLQVGQNFTVEVATLSKARDESFGNSLVLIDVYEAKD